jgi:hypothetical protein
LESFAVIPLPGIADWVSWFQFIFLIFSPVDILARIPPDEKEAITVCDDLTSCERKKFVFIPCSW